MTVREKIPFVGVFVPWTPGRKNSPGWVTDANGCDIWHGATVRGYAKVRAHGKACLVTRIRYEREIGPIPEGMELDHFVCDNGSGGCCNPFHCRPTTHRENVLRSNSAAAIHAGKTHCPKGHPLSGENLDSSSFAKRGQRKCRTCQNTRSKSAGRARRKLARGGRLRHREAYWAQRLAGGA